MPWQEKFKKYIAEGLVTGDLAYSLLASFGQWYCNHLWGWDKEKLLPPEEKELDQLYAAALRAFHDGRYQECVEKLLELEGLIPSRRR
ncbi:hypothetical protein KC644_01840 [Candidatus Berkelbacteria bacterium]|nr:hypothetical protein [Candidatus Berkelbacteria bacterium]